MEKWIYTVGIGCKKGCGAKELEQLLNVCLSKSNLTLKSIHSISTVKFKMDEAGLVQLYTKCGLQFFTYSPSVLNVIDSPIVYASPRLYRYTGVYSVAEASAYETAKRNGNDVHKVIGKQSSKNATCAIYKSKL